MSWNFRFVCFPLSVHGVQFGLRPGHSNLGGAASGTKWRLIIDCFAAPMAIMLHIFTLQERVGLGKHRKDVAGSIGQRIDVGAERRSMREKSRLRISTWRHKHSTDQR